MSTTSDRTTCRKPTNCSMSSTALADSDRAGRNEDQRERHELEPSEESEPSVESEEFESARSSEPADAEDDASLGAGSATAPVCVLALLLSDGAAEGEEEGGAAETAAEGVAVAAAALAAVAAECIEAIRMYGVHAQASLYEVAAATAVRGCRKAAVTGGLWRPAAAAILIGPPRVRRASAALVHMQRKGKGATAALRRMRRRMKNENVVSLLR